MITAGVDVGAETIKVVILEDSKIASYAILKAGFEAQETCDKALELALGKTNLSRSDISQFVATGIGGKEVSYAGNSVTEIVADARGAAWLFPQVRTVIDVGAEGARGVHCDSAGKVINYAMHEKCAAGAGAFIETMARALEVTIEDMGALSQKSTRDISLNITCAVFAESEVVSLIHAKTPKPDIARAIHESIARRVTSIVRRIGIEEEVVFLGGVAKNIGVVERLKHNLGTEVIIPEESQIVTALGAALIAQGKEGG